MSAPPAGYTVGSANAAAPAALAPYVICQGNAGTGSATLAVTVATPNAQGDAILVWCTNNSLGLTSVSDPVNGTYTPCGSGAVINGAFHGRWFVMLNAQPLTTSQAITLTLNGTTSSKTLQAFGCSGVAAVNGLDINAVNATGTGTAPQAVSGTLTYARELVLAGLVANSVAGSPTWSAPFTLLGANQNPAEWSSAASDAVSATTTVTATATIASTTWGVQLISVVGVSSLAIGVSGPSSAGDALVVGAECNGGIVQSVADSQGNGYAQRGSSTATAQATFAWSADYSTNTAGTRALASTDTVTVTFLGASSALVAGVTGIQGLALQAFDQAVSATGTSVTASATSGTLAQAAEVAVAVCGFANAGGNPLWLALNGWFISYNQVNGSSDHVSAAWHSPTSSTTALTATTTLQASVAWAMVEVLFRMYVPHSPTLPQLQVLAGFGASPGTGLPTQWTDITPFARSGQIIRQGSRLAGPLWQWQAGSCSVVLKNGDGRFDPDNFAGPYTATRKTITQTFAKSGSWTAPANLIGGTVNAQCWGAGGGAESGEAGTGQGGSGGGGGEFAQEASLAVTAGLTYAYTVGAGGAGGAGTFGSSGSPGSNGGNSTFAGDSVTVTANGGKGGGSPGGAGGSGSTNTTHFPGGNGGVSGASQNGGSGGGSSAGSLAGGANGTNSSSNAGAAGGVAPLGGGNGGNGGKGGFTNAQAGNNGSGPGGGAGGGGNHTYNNFGERGGTGAGGTVTITYQVSVPAGTLSLIAPGVAVRIQATFAGTVYPLFTGYTDQWQDSGANIPKYAEVTLIATDAFEPLGLAFLAAQGSAQGSGLDSGALITLLLNAISWPPSLRNIDVGNTITQGTLEGDYAQNLLQTIADTEGGSLYVDASGNVTFWRRQGIWYDTRATTPQGVFGDSPGTVHTAGTELPYYTPQRANDNTTLFNDVQNTRTGGTLQEAQDLVSQAVFFLRSYQRSGLLQNSDTDALSWAQFVLFIADSVEDRIDQLTIDPQRDITDLYPQVLGREIGDRIEIWRRPPNVAAFSKDCYIRGVSHTWDEVNWQTTWTTQDASKYGSFWTLNDPVLGRLNFNALAY